MKIIYAVAVLFSFTAMSTQCFSQQKVKDTPEKIVIKDKNQNVVTKEKPDAFLAVSDSVKIKNRHGRVKTKDFTKRTIIKEKGSSVKFKNKIDGSWMKEKNGHIKTSKNYNEKKTDSV